MSIDSNDIFEHLEQLNILTKDLVKESLTSWRKSHEAELELFSSVFENNLDRLNKLLKSDFCAPGLWKELEITLTKYLEWTQSLNYVKEDDSSTTLWKGWKDQFLECLKSLPQQPTVPFSEHYLDDQPNESFLIRFWKRYKRMRIWLKERRLFIVNKTRILFKRTPLSSPPWLRKFKLHLFFKNYWELPVARFLLQEWQRFLRQIAGQLYELHLTTKDIMNDLLFLEDFKEFCLNPDLDKISSKLQKLNVKLESSNLFFEDLKEFEVESIARLEEWLIELRKDVQRGWEFAGTIILPAREFSENKIASKWARLDESFIKSKQAWARHFQGEKVDWRKDLELSILQLQTGQICLDTLNSIERKINEDILPTFSEPIEMISNSLEKFQAIDKDRETNLKSDILSENRLMLRSLQREKLPYMMDTILQTQVNKALENYSSRIKHCINNLPAQHIIFHNRDLESLQPTSKVVEVAMRELVLEEFFSKLNEKQETFTDSIHEQLEQILRDISEIDQIVEFNMEAALELLRQEEESDVISEACEVVIEGLERTKNQLTTLTQENKQIERCTKDTLLQTTVEFEQQIHELLNNERIIEIKFRLARAKTKEEIRGYRKKVLKVIKASLPYLLTFLTGSFKRTKDTYFRLRKVTGLAPTTIDADERLLLFITETQKRISKLPFVYQRLFRNEPLSDERFFVGREEELELLKREFESWQRGQYGVTALVGEKGSGRTTIINFARQEIYSGLPFIKMDLAGLTMHTEECLLNYLKESLKEHDIEDLDDLETKIMRQEGRKIIVVEDLQNLFMRTVGGFDALEKFLLFVSRTDERIHWVLTCSLYSWRYLDKVVNISKFFQKTIFLSGLTREEVENVTLKRHRVSGYKLLFEVPEEVLKSRKFKKLTSDQDRQEYLTDSFFDQLNKLAAGNISVTMMYWLSAVKGILKDTLVLSPTINFDYSSVDSLPPEDLFTLAALLQHESLSVEDHTIVFHQDSQQSSLLLNRMTNKGILIEKVGGCQINPLLYRPIVQSLKVKNFIH